MSPTVTDPGAEISVPTSTSRYTVKGGITPNLLAEVWATAPFSTATMPAKSPTSTAPLVTQRVGNDGTFGMDVTLSAPIGQPNLFVVTTFDPVNQLESPPTQVPSITVATPTPSAPVITNPASSTLPAGVQVTSGTSRYQITGTGAPNLQIWIFQADPTSTPATPVKQAGSTPVATSIIGADGTFSVESNLVASPGQPNLFVATVYDGQNKTESATASVPPITVLA